MQRLVILSAVLVCAVLVRADAQGPPLRVCMLSGSAEYESDKTLAAYQAHIEKEYNVRCTLLKAPTVDDLPGLEALDNCDVALFFTRRLTIKGEQLDRVKRYCEAGRPIVGVRTACHGFQNWLEFDPLVLGGNYTGHYGAGPTMQTQIVPEAKDHPILQGVPPIESKGSLYKCAPLAEDTQLLMTGSTAESGGSQPVAWTRIYKGGRVFYTSLGAQGDFENDVFLRMLTNALFWTAKREVERKEPATAH